MIEPDLEKTPEAVRQHIAKGKKLKVGGDVLIGLDNWETLVPKPKEVDAFLENMKEELNAAKAQRAKLLGPADVPKHFTTAQRYIALGYQGKGMEFIRRQSEGKDLTPFLTAPQTLHRQPRTLPIGAYIVLYLNGKRVKIDFSGFGTAPNGDITLGFKAAGEEITVNVPDPNANVVANGPRKAEVGNKNEYGTVVPGEVLSYSVKIGDVLKKGSAMCVLESMKMEVKLSVPDYMDGMQVKKLPCKTRTATDQGDILSPGQLLIEVEARK